MAKPNRTRRNARKADQYKEFAAKATRRKNTEKPTDEEAVEKLIEERSEIIIKILRRMERERLSENDGRIVATFATKDGIMSYAKNQEVNDLGELQVEELTEFEFNSVVTRANHAINTLLHNRRTYIAGPFYVNRGMRQAAITRTRHARHIKVKKPTTAAGIVAAMRAKKAAKAAVGM